jgi:hypothetical protein
MVSRPGGWVPATLMTPSRSYPPIPPSASVWRHRMREEIEGLGELVFVGVAAGAEARDKPMIFVGDAVGDSDDNSDAVCRNEGVRYNVVGACGPDCRFFELERIEIPDKQLLRHRLNLPSQFLTSACLLSLPTTAHPFTWRFKSSD